MAATGATVVALAPFTRPRIQPDVVDRSPPMTGVRFALHPPSRGPGSMSKPRQETTKIARAGVLSLALLPSTPQCALRFFQIAPGIALAGCSGLRGCRHEDLDRRGQSNPGRRAAQETRGHGARGGRHRRWSASVEPAPGQARAAGDLGLDDAGDERTGALPQDPSRTDRDRMPRDRELRRRDHRVPKDLPHSSRRPANPPSSWLGPMVEIAWSISRSPPRMRPSPDRLPGSVEFDDLVRIIDDNRDQGLEVVVPAGLGRRHDDVLLGGGNNDLQRRGLGKTLVQRRTRGSRRRLTWNPQRRGGRPPRGGPCLQAWSDAGWLPGGRPRAKLPCPIKLRRARDFVWSQVNTKLVAAQRDPVVGQERRPANLLTLDLGAVGADQVADHEQSIGLDQQTVPFGEAGVVDNDIAVSAPADEHDIARDGDWRISVFWNQFGLHRWLVNTEVRPTNPLRSLHKSTSSLTLSQAFMAA